MMMYSTEVAPAGLVFFRDFIERLHFNRLDKQGQGSISH